MITKVCQFPARHDLGEQLVEVFHPGNLEKAAVFFGMGKTAAPLLPEMQQLLETLQPHPNKIYILVNALGAGEYWSSNSNGDYFPEASLIHRGPIYGYETFYQAHLFRHHQNKDASRSLGDIVISCWHDLMKRVELVVCVYRDRAEKFGGQDFCDKLDHGIFPDVSMGTRVPFDTCCICLDLEKYYDAQATFNPHTHQSVGKAVLAFHKHDPIRGLSVTKSDYCLHLRTQLNKILTDGRKVYAINDYPRFFDISGVFIGAEKTAKVMAKLAFYDIGYTGDVVPSWYIAESMGYNQDFLEKTALEIPNVSTSVLSSVAPFTKEVAQAIISKYQPERLTLKKAVKVYKQLSNLGTPVPPVPDLEPEIEPFFKEETKTAGINSVRAQLRIKNASQKRAEIDKNVVPSQFSSKTIPLNFNKSPDLPNEVLDALGKSSLSEGLSTPTIMGMLLRPREFQRITVVNMGKKDLADQLDDTGTIFSHTPVRDMQTPIGDEYFSEMLKKLLLPFMEDRGMFEPIAKRRIIRITINGEEGGNQFKEKRASNTLFLNGISAAYNHYLDNVSNCLMKSAEIIIKHPDLWERIYKEGLLEGLTKQAAGEHKVNPAVLLGAVGGAYALSEWAKSQRESAQMGRREPVGVVMDLLANNPTLAMFLAGLGALHQQGSTIPRRIVEGILRERKSS
jgi:hypothetical protein